MSLLEELGASTAEKVGERPRTEYPRTMTDVMSTFGINDPNCAGLRPALFLVELAQERDPEIINYAAEICLGCGPAPHCPINKSMLRLKEGLQGHEHAPVDLAPVSSD